MAIRETLPSVTTRTIFDLGERLQYRVWDDIAVWRYCTCFGPCRCGRAQHRLDYLRRVQQDSPFTRPWPTLGYPKPASGRPR